MRAAIVAVVGAIVASGVAPARADEVTLSDPPAVIEIPRGWTRVDRPGIVAGYRGGGGALLAITRARLSNVDAYRSKDRDAYIDQIERGVARAVPGYQRVARRLSDQSGTPALDLEARRADGATIVVRVLLFWNHALSLAIEVPPRRDAAAARAIAASFLPPRAPAR